MIELTEDPDTFPHRQGTEIKVTADPPVDVEAKAS
jgi:hypothetical protein